MTEETWPSWRYGPNGEAQIYQSADEVPAGWKDHQFAKTAEESDSNAFDHDGDSKSGGSTSGGSGDEMKALRAEYEKAIGKKPFSGWDAETLREKMEAAKP